MTDQPPETTQVATRAPREVRVVEDHVAIFDTAKFEQFGRVASVMAETGMMPETLRGYKEGRGDNAVFVEHPMIVQKARAFMIVELADRLSFSPFGLMGACSFVHGRLMLEGKVVHAAIQRKLSVDLDYLFGTWIPADERTDLELGEGKGDLLGVIVRGALPNGELREVHGSVGIWKTSGNGSPWRPGAMKRQCRYRGAREWERAYSPGLTLGVTFDDEWEGDLIEAATPPQQRPQRGRVKADVVGRLSPPAEGTAGFSQAHVEAETATPGADHDPETGEVIENGGESSTTTSSSGQTSEQTQTGTLDASTIISSTENQSKVGELIGDDDLPEGLRPKPGEGQKASPPATDVAPPADDEPEVDPLETFWNAVRAAGTQRGIKDALPAVYNSDEFNEMEPEDQISFRREVYAFAQSIGDVPDHAADPTVFRLWMDTQVGRDGADAIQGTLDILRQSEAFGRMKEPSQNRVIDASQARIAQLRTAK